MKKKVLVAALTASALLGITYSLASCGDGTSQNVSELKPEVTVTNAKVEGLKETYKTGETVTFIVTPDTDYTVESVTVNGLKVAPGAEGYSYTLTENDTVLTIVVSTRSTYIKATTTISNGKVVGLKDKYKVGEFVKFSLELDKDYIEKSVTLNGTKLNKSGSEYVYQVKKTDTKLEIVVETVLVVEVTGKITSGGETLPETFRTLVEEVVFEDKNGNVTSGAVTGNVTDGYGFKVTVPSGEYTVKVYALTFCETPKYEVYSKEIVVNDASRVANIDLDLTSFYRTIEGNDHVIKADEADDVMKQVFNVGQNKGYFSANDSFSETFTLSLETKMFDENNNLIVDPTFGNNPNGLVAIEIPKWYQGIQNGSIQIVHWNGNWFAKIFGANKDKPEQLINSEGVLPKEALLKLNSKEGLTFTLDRVVKNDSATFTLSLNLDGKIVSLGTLRNCKPMPVEFMDFKRNNTFVPVENRGDCAIKNQQFVIHKQHEDFTQKEYYRYGRNCEATDGKKLEGQFWNPDLFGLIEGNYTMSFRIGNNRLLDENGEIYVDYNGLKCAIPLWDSTNAENNFGLNFENKGKGEAAEYRLYFWRKDYGNNFYMRLSPKDIEAYDAQNLKVTFEKTSEAVSIYFTDLEGTTTKKFEKAVTDEFLKNQRGHWGDFNVEATQIGNYKLHDLEVATNVAPVTGVKSVINTVDKKEVTLKKDVDEYQEATLFNRRYGDTRANQAMGGKLVVPGLLKDGKIDETKLGANIEFTYNEIIPGAEPNTEITNKFNVVLKLNKETKQVELCSGDKVLKVLTEAELNLLNTTGLEFAYLSILNKDYLMDFKFYLQDEVYDVSLNYARVEVTTQAAVLAALDKDISPEAKASIIDFKLANFSSDVSIEEILATVK